MRLRRRKAQTARRTDLQDNVILKIKEKKGSQYFGYLVLVDKRDQNGNVILCIAQRKSVGKN